MEVREPVANYLAQPAFKQTEVGLIPEDWDSVPLADVSQCLVGLTYSPSDVRQFGTLVLRSSNVQEGRLAFEDNVYVDMEIPQRAITQEGDILICVRNGSRNLIGKCAVIDRATAGSSFGAFMAVLRSQSGEYLFQQFQSRVLKKQIGDRMGATINQITNKDMGEFVVAWPREKTERNAIAEALSDADALIEALEQLLAKKRQIKQGAMQELLTGQRRLPGFAGEWKTITLGMIGELLKGAGITRDEAQSGSLPCVRYGEIYTTHDDYIRAFQSWISAEVASRATRLRQGDLLFAGSGETKEEIGKCIAFVDDVEAYAGGDIVILRPRGFDSLFLGYALNTADVNRQKASRGQGDAVVHVSAAALAQIEIHVPEAPEQSAIATLLSDMDAEITAIEAKLAKARAVKQGMMQELLTGRIRLV